MVVQLLMAQGDGDNALGDAGAQGALDPVGVAAMAEAGRHLVKGRQGPIDLGNSRAPASEVMGPPSIAVTTGRRPKHSSSSGSVVDCMRIAFPHGIWLTSDVKSGLARVNNLHRIHT